MKIYVGATGHLNKKIIGNCKNSFDVITSARNFNLTEIINKEKPSDIILTWAGRYAPDDEITQIFKNSYCTYISTFIYNDFHDYYQHLKLKDEYHLEKQNWRILRVPFINEILPSNVNSLINRNRNKLSNYYIHITDISMITYAIENLSDLSTNRLYLNLKVREKIIWNIYSFIYMIPPKFNLIKKSYSYNFLKLCEKLTLKIFMTHNLSSVYIGKEKKQQ
ncbi:hypothetical protein [Providencia sp. PROV118]|uniref:hypothetical protein n=1 Tax=Providencia sp. PROV118 TaxID=2949829 RepID=UPI002349926F|nr:hypothetical protein [Providencia sp. PROV118]